jgi:hypothetical protein
VTSKLSIFSHSPICCNSIALSIATRGTRKKPLGARTMRCQEGRACHFPATALWSHVGGNKGRDILTPALAQLHNLSPSHPCLVYHFQRRLYTDIASCYDLFLGYPHRYKHQSHTPAHTSRSSRVSARSSLLLSTTTKVPASPQVRVIVRVIVRTIESAICDN